MEINLTGRIENIEFHEGQYFTTLLCAAPDAYSTPESYKIKSDHQFGGVGNEFSVKADQRCYVRVRKYKDKQTGQPKEYREQVIYIDLLEAKPVTSKRIQ